MKMVRAAFVRLHRLVRRQGHPRTALLDAALGLKALTFADIIPCEVLQGYRRQEDSNPARQALLQFPVYPIGGTEMAIKSTEYYPALRR